MNMFLMKVEMDSRYKYANPNVFIAIIKVSINNFKMDITKLSNKHNFIVMFSKHETYFILTTQLRNYKYLILD